MSFSFLKCSTFKKSSHRYNINTVQNTLCIENHIHNQHLSRRCWFFTICAACLSTRRQLCCMTCYAEHKLRTTKLYVTAMMQKGRAFPTSTAATNQVWTTCCTVAGFHYFLHTKTYSSTWSLRFGVLSNLCRSKQFVFADLGGVKILRRYNMSVDFVGKVTRVQNIVYVCSMFTVVYELILFWRLWRNKITK